MRRGQWRFPNRADSSDSGPFGSHTRMTGGSLQHLEVESEERNASAIARHNYMLTIMAGVSQEMNRTESD